MTEINPMEARNSQLLQTFKNSEMITWSRQRTSEELGDFISRRIDAVGDLSLN